MTNAAAADEALLDLGDIDPPVSTSEADDFILDLQDDAPYAPAPEPAQASASWSEAAQPAVEAATVGANSDFAPQPVAGSSAHGLAVDVPPSNTEPAGASAAYDFEEAPATEAYRAVEEEPGVMEATEVEEDAPEASPLQSEPQAVPHSFPAATVEAAPNAGQITLDQLSPEAIDAIARRAVELLSTKVVEEVAWEVVPQLAELLIKRKLEEEKAK
jgi:hypothetical protein